MNVSLFVIEPTDEDPLEYYVLHVRDDDDNLISEIPVASFSPEYSGMSMQKWKHSTRKLDQGKNVIGVYFWISAMGHELDQWRYYDLDLGKDVTRRS